MLRRITGVCGIASQALGLISLLVAVSMSPWFSWTENYISVLGIRGSATTLFNSGLILTGVLSLIFAIGLGKNLLSARLAGRLGVIGLALASASFSAIGMFPRASGISHSYASLAFFLFTSLSIFLIGITVIATSQKIWGSFEFHSGYFYSCLSSGCVALDWWSYSTVAFLFAMVIVDNSL